MNCKLFTAGFVAVVFTLPVLVSMRDGNWGTAFLVALMCGLIIAWIVWPDDVPSEEP